MITQERLKELLHYDSDTGLFTWLVSRGKAAGSMYVNQSSGKKYKRISIARKHYRSHRLAWLYVHGVMPRYGIDHINGDGTDNRLVNLRDVSRADNSRNRKLQCNSSSGASGVRFEDGKWRSYIYSEGKRISLGRFTDFFEAVCTRKSAELLYGFHVNHGAVRPL